MDSEQARLIPFTQRFLSEGKNGTVQRNRDELRGLQCPGGKSRSKVPGVTSCSVSLLTNSMGVEGTARPGHRQGRAGSRGYGASPKNAAAQSAQRRADALADHETPAPQEAASSHRWSFWLC